MIKPRILVVDDEEVVTRLVAAILRGTGMYEVETCNDSSEAFERAFSETFHLLISDVRMPLMDGDQLYSNLMDLQGACVDRLPPKLLLMSGALNESELAERAGTIFFLPKPFAPEFLVAQVAYILGEDTPSHPFRPMLEPELRSH